MAIPAIMVMTTYLGAWIPVMVRIKLVLLHLVGVFFPDFRLGHLLTYPRIKLTHLRSLPDLVSFCRKKFGRLYCSAPGRSPNDQRFQWRVRRTLLNKLRSFFLSMTK